MKVIYDPPSTVYKPGIFVGKCVIGHTQAVANWYTVRGMRGSAASIMSYLNSYADGAAERPLIPGVPETEEFEIDGTKLAYVRGIIPGRASTKGTLTGTYRIVLCHLEDVLEVLVEQFDYKTVVSRRLSA